MKYEGKEINKTESIKKHKEHIQKNDVIFSTSDGNCFVGLNAEIKAQNHSTSYRPSLMVFDLTKINNKKQSK